MSKSIVKCEFVPREVFARRELYSENMTESIKRLEPLVLDAARRLPTEYSKGLEVSTEKFHGSDSSGNNVYAGITISNGSFEERTHALAVLLHACTISLGQGQKTQYVPKATIVFHDEDRTLSAKVIDAFTPTFLYDATGLDRYTLEPMPSLMRLDGEETKEGFSVLDYFGRKETIDSIIFETGVAFSCDLALSDPRCYLAPQPRPMLSTRPATKSSKKGLWQKLKSYFTSSLDGERELNIKLQAITEGVCSLCWGPYAPLAIGDKLLNCREHEEVKVHYKCAVDNRVRSCVVLSCKDEYPGVASQIRIARRYDSSSVKRPFSKP